MADKYADLEKRLRECTGPDREADGAIHNAVMNASVVRSSESPTGFLTSRHDNGCPTVAHYTASVDAALSLVPELVWLTIETGTQKSPPHFAWPVVSTGRQDREDDLIWKGQLVTVPLTVCLAAIIARRSTGEP